MQFQYQTADGTSHDATAAELKALAQAGDISSETPVRKVGAEKWSKAGQVKGLVFGVSEDDFLESLEPPPESEPSADLGSTQQQHDSRGGESHGAGKARRWRTRYTGEWQVVAEDTNRFATIVRNIGNGILALGAMVAILGLLAGVGSESPTIFWAGLLGGAILWVQGLIVRGLSGIVRAVTLYALDRVDGSS